MVGFEHVRTCFKHEHELINAESPAGFNYISQLTQLAKKRFRPATALIVPSVIISEEHRGALLSWTVGFTRDPALVAPGDPRAPVPTILIPVTSNPHHLSQALPQSF